MLPDGADRQVPPVSLSLHDTSLSLEEESYLCVLDDFLWLLRDLMSPLWTSLPGEKQSKLKTEITVLNQLGHYLAVIQIEMFGLDSRL